MKISKVHCLFEQSGTFKNEFIRLGIPAEDYDILDDFGQTDHRIDLFREIGEAYDGRDSLFGKVKDDELILAFFPCTRFEAKVPLMFRGEQNQMRAWDAEKKLACAMRLHDELHLMYTLICKMFSVCIRGGVPPDCRKSVHTAPLSDRILSGETEADYQG